MKRPVIILFVITLLAAACGGGGETASTMETLDKQLTDTLPSTPSTAGQGGTTGTTATQPGTTSLPESDYPDVVVADLAGGEVNLKELALESEPVLLWFWAPH